MPSPYLNNLIQIARVDLPQLAHDLENASTIYTVQEAAKRMHNIVTYLVHHVILSDPSTIAAAAAAAQQQQQAPALPPPPAGYRYVRGNDGRVYLAAVTGGPQQAPTVGHAPAVDHYPSQIPAVPMAPPNQLGVGGLPLVSLTPLGASTPEAPTPGQGSRVAEVTITPQGTRVALPGKPAMTVPSGVPVDATGGVGNGADVVLPEGGAMPPEVAAALARRSTEPPMMDASGGARNITNE